MLVSLCFIVGVKAQYPEIETELDKKVKAFLEENVNDWRDMNVPLSDGKILYDIIVENGYKKCCRNRNFNRTFSCLDGLGFK